MRTLLLAMLSVSLAIVAMPAASADWICTPYHEVCVFNPADGQHADASAAGVSVGAGDYDASAWGDCAHGNCFHGQAVEVFAPAGTFAEARIGSDGIYPYTYAGAQAAGTTVASYYHNDQYDPVTGFNCLSVGPVYGACGWGVLALLP
jgi:hypothetical protein